MSDKSLTDQEIDALLVRSLARLGAHSPSRQFADSVMARVALPHPRPVVLLRRAREWVSQPRRVLVLAGGYVVSAAVALAFAVPWLLSNIPAISLAAQWTVARAGELGRESLLAVARWSVTSGLTGFVESLPISGPSVFAGAGALVAGYGACAIGLHHLMRAPRGKDAPVKIRA